MQHGDTLWIDAQDRVGVAERSGVVRFELELLEERIEGDPWAIEEMWTGEEQVEFEVVETLEEAIRPVESEVIASLLEEHLRALVVIMPPSYAEAHPILMQGSEETYPEDAFHAALEAEGIDAFACRVALLRNGEVVAAGAPFLMRDDFSWQPPDGGLLEDSYGSSEEIQWGDIDPALMEGDLGASEWWLRVRSDGELALRHLSAASYWRGEVRIPIDRSALTIGKHD